MAVPVAVQAGGLGRDSRASGLIELLFRLMSVQAMRRRMPLWAFILLAVLCLVLFGIACACATNHPVQKIDGPLGAIPATAPLVEVWTFAFGALVMFVALDVRRRPGDTASSPAVLQCFLFLSRK